ERLGELLGHRAMHPAVEVQAHVQPFRLCRLDPLDDFVEQSRGSDPVEIRGRIHLDRGEALALAGPRRLANLMRPVAADPGISADSVANLAAEQLPDRNAERPALEVPQRLVEPSEG